MKRLPRPLALTLRLDRARRPLAARAFLAGLVALGFGGVARATCGRDAGGQAGLLIAGHNVTRVKAIELLRTPAQFRTP